MRSSTAQASEPVGKPVKHGIDVIAGKEVVTPAILKSGETVQFSSTDGQIKIQFDGEWPFEGTKHDIIGSEVDQPGELSTSEILTLVAGEKPTKFQCFIKPAGAPNFLNWKYGGEIKPRGK